MKIENESEKKDDNVKLYLQQSTVSNKPKIVKKSQPIGSVETIRWLKKRFEKSAKEHYLMTGTENKQFEEIKTVFNNFDFDGSQTLDVAEVTEMLTQNNINIPVTTLKALFAIIEPDQPAELCLEEFIRFSFDKKANTKFRNLIQRIRNNFKSDDMCKQGIFLPFSFTTLLNYLAVKANRSNLLDNIKNNELKIDTILKDIDMFEELFNLSSNQENTMNQDTYIYREIKLEKELNKIKKKIHRKMARQELKDLLPYEEFLRRALRDSDSEGDESEKEQNNGDESSINIIIPKPRLSIPKIKINDQTPSNRAQQKSPSKSPSRSPAQVIKSTEDLLDINNSQEIQPQVDNQSNINSERLLQPRLLTLASDVGSLGISKQKSSPRRTQPLTEVPLLQIDKFDQTNRTFSQQNKSSHSHKSIVPMSLLKDSFVKQYEQRQEDKLNDELVQAREQTLERVRDIILLAQNEVQRDRPNLLKKFLKGWQSNDNQSVFQSKFFHPSRHLQKSETQLKEFKRCSFGVQAFNPSNQSSLQPSPTNQGSSQANLIFRDAKSNLITIPENKVRPFSESLKRSSGGQKSATQRLGMISFQKHRSYKPLSHNSSLNALPSASKNLGSNFASSLNLRNFSQNAKSLLSKRDLGASSSVFNEASSNINSLKMIAGERPVMNDQQVKTAMGKFQKKEFQHFNIMLRVKSPKEKYRRREKQNLLKESLVEIVGNQLQDIKQSENAKLKWTYGKPFLSRVKNNIESVHANFLKSTIK